MSLMVSISGVRGIIGESLTPDIIVNFSSAFGEYCKGGAIVLGRDGRIGGKIIGNLVSSTLLSMGCDVVALGICPTPTVQLAVERLNASGGISITASHNPMGWNGLKFLASTGMFLNHEENAALLKIAENTKRTYTSWKKLGTHRLEDNFIDLHLEAVYTLPYLNLERIRAKKWKIVVDCVNSAGGLIVPKLLRTLGCTVIEMNCDVSGIFAHAPEPIPENLTELCNRVRIEKADLGIAVDPDVDRLVFIDERGEPIGEEYTIAIAVQFLLSREAQMSDATQRVVVNLSTTRAVDDIAKRFNAEVYRTPVGEINVAKKMKEIGAVIGGEGSGGVILPAVHYGRDAIVGIGLMLQHLTDSGKPLSQLKASCPQYVISKQKIEIGNNNAEALLVRVKSKYSNAERVNMDDGLKIDFNDCWVHLRKSNTEPIIRIIAEAPTQKRTEELIHEFKTLLSSETN